MCECFEGSAYQEIQRTTIHLECNLKRNHSLRLRVMRTAEIAALKFAMSLLEAGRCLSCSVAPFFHLFLVAAPLKMVFPKKGSLFFRVTE